MAWTQEPGSFRDPSGFIFSSDGVLYRQVNTSFGDQYRHLIDSGLYAELVRDGLLISHEEVELRLSDAPPAFAVLLPAKIPFISYPYEWCFGQYKAAAQLTLEVQRRALARGLALRDASAYNVQFVGARPIFIDTLSFGTYVEGRPWTAYRQFCQHFLGPLALMALVDPSLGQLTRVHLDGIPLANARRLLPFSSRLRAGVLMHLHLHARSSVEGPQQHAHAPKAADARRMGKTAMLGLVDSLARTVRNLSWTPPPTLWSTYTDHSNYTDAAHAHKQQLVAQWFDRLAAQSTPQIVWDLGANTGVYSRIVAERGSTVVSFDLDHAAVEQHFQTCRALPGGRILPLIQDLTNPSPGAGWGHAERKSLEQRGPADVAMALALVHHLVISGNVPLGAVAAFLRQVCRHLIIEFVPNEDSQVQRMLALREATFADYSQTGFEAAFAPHFKTIVSTSIEGTMRTLYLMERR